MADPVDRTCLDYVDAFDRRDLAAMRAIRAAANAATRAALDEVLDGLIHEYQNPDMTDAQIDDALERADP